MASGNEGLESVKVGRFWGSPEVPLEMKTVNYIAAAMKAADHNSTFMQDDMNRAAVQRLSVAENQRNGRDQAVRDIIDFMIARDFGGIVFGKDGKVVGHVLGQRRGDTLHIFDIYVLGEDNRRKGTGTQMVGNIAYQLVPTQINWMRIGAGNCAAVEGIRKKLLTDRKGFPYLVNKQPRKHKDQLGWLSIKKPK